MTRYGFVIDVSRCIDCDACMVACKVQWNVSPGHSRNWVYDMGLEGAYPLLEHHFVPGNCMHCDNPPCVDACPSGATYKMDNGLVLIDQDACIGCGYCIAACPYDARFYDEVKGVVDKCTGCWERVAAGEEPACVATCVGGSRMFGDLDDPDSDVSKALRSVPTTRLVTEMINPGPNIYYVHMPSHIEDKLAPRAINQTAAGETWEKLVIPVVGAAIGATFAGQAVAYAKHLLGGEGDDDESLAHVKDEEKKEG